MKKLLAMLLTLIMLLTIMPAVMAESTPPTVLTVGSTKSNYDFEKWEFMRELEAEMNIKLEFTYYDQDTFAVMIADGNMPDIMLSRFKFLAPLMRSGLALNIEPYIDEYLPNLKSPLYAPTNEILKKLFVTEDNGIYFLCPMVGVYNGKGGTGQYRGYIVRWDYYKELGCPEIHNDADYIDVLLKMWENHPTNEEGKPNWAYGVYNSLKNMGGYRASWTSECAVNLYSDYQYKASLYDNKLVNGYTDTERSSFWRDMRFQNALYRAGAYNEEMFIITDDELDAQIAEGRYMGLHFVDDALWENKSKEDPETLAGYVVVPSDGSILYADCMLMLGNAPTYYTVINSKSENKFLAMEFYNHIYDEDFVRTWYSGKQGRDWDYDENGVPKLFPETIEKIANNDPTFVGEGYADYDAYITGYTGTMVHSDGHFMNLLQESDAMKDSQTYLQRDFANYYGEDYWLDALYKHMRSNNTDASETIVAAMSDVPDDVDRALTLCDDVLKSHMADLIMAESDEDFAAIQEDMLKEIEELGEPACWDWYNTKWEEAREIVQPYFDAACEAAGLK